MHKPVDRWCKNKLKLEWMILASTTMYRSTDVLNIVDKTTGTQNARVNRRAYCVQENTNSKNAQHRELNTIVPNL